MSLLALSEVCTYCEVSPVDASFAKRLTDGANMALSTNSILKKVRLFNVNEVAKSNGKWIKFNVFCA